VLYSIYRPGGLKNNEFYKGVEIMEMANMRSKNTTQLWLIIIFSILTVGYVVLMAASRDFFEWTFSRHQNILSWYVRPLFMLPIFIFAFKRNGAGIAITVFLMATSMFWFPVPKAIDPNVQEFLAMERGYLTSEWTIAKILVASMVPISLGIMCLALWLRKIKIGIFVVVAIAVGKMAWSVAEGGTSGQKVLIPALLGLFICIIGIVFVLRHMKKTKDE